MYSITTCLLGFVEHDQLKNGYSPVPFRNQHAVYIMILLLFFVCETLNVIEYSFIWQSYRRGRIWVLPDRSINTSEQNQAPNNWARLWYRRRKPADVWSHPNRWTIFRHRDTQAVTVGSTLTILSTSHRQGLHRLRILSRLLRPIRLPQP